jgi:hypothetical protein
MQPEFDSVIVLPADKLGVSSRLRTTVGPPRVSRPAFHLLLCSERGWRLEMRR